jgi:dihydroorotase
MVDPKKVSRINADRLHSRAEWTPFEGLSAIFPQMTLLRGEVIFDGEIAAKPGFGRFQGRKRIL